MTFLSYLFFTSLLLGQVGGISVSPGIVIYIHDIAIAILLGEGFVQYAVKSTFVRPKLGVPIALFAGAAVLSLLANSGVVPLDKLGLSSLYLVRWLFYGALYVLVLQTYVKKELWSYGLFAVGIGFGVLGLVQFFLYPDLRNLMYLGWDPHFYRLFSTLLDPNFAGFLFVLTILWGLYLWEEKRTRWVIVGGEVIVLVSLLLTYSRSSFLALAAAIVTLAAVRKQRKILIGIAILGLLVMFVPKIPGSTLSLLRTDSTFARIGSWQQGLALTREAPVFGHGFDTLRYVTTSKGEFISKSAAGVDSSILFITATTGIVGLLAYGFLVYTMVKLGKSLLHNKKFVTLGAVYLASLVALGIHSLFVNSAFYAWVMVWVWVLTGVVERSFDSKTRSG